MSPDQQYPNETCKRGRKHRKRASDELSIEELHPDDMGYDGDVEVIRPDKYEEPESDLEDTTIPHKPWQNLDEELAARMRQLGREQNARSSLSQPTTDRGRKRGSCEIEDDFSMLNVPLSPDLEVQEIIDPDKPSPAKRRRKKSRRPNAAQHILRTHTENWTDSSDRTDSNTKVLRNRSTSATTESDVAARDGGEAMDMT